MAVTAPSKHQTSTVIENTAEVAVRRAPNSAAIGLKNAPKLQATAYTAHIATKAAATINHARDESNSSSDGSGSRDSAAPSAFESVAFMLEPDARRFQFLALGGVDDWIVELQVFQCVNDRGGHDQAREPFVVGWDDIPRRMLARGMLGSFPLCGHIVIPALAFTTSAGDSFQFFWVPSRPLRGNAASVPPWRH